MTKRILIMGLPGTGKSSLADRLWTKMYDSGLKIKWFNADVIRKLYNDWDFSLEGRLRQAQRMRDLADIDPDLDFVICDFVCPLPEMRDIFNADYVVWMDTEKQSSYIDTDKLFVEPATYNLRVITKNANMWSDFILKELEK